jgi:hypothetical protein
MMPCMWSYLNTQNYQKSKNAHDRKKDAISVTKHSTKVIIKLINKEIKLV